MATILEDVVDETTIPENVDIIDIYYSIISEKSFFYIVYYLKLNNSFVYDSFVNYDDLSRIFRSPEINEKGIIFYNGFYYRIIQVILKERLFKNIGIISAATTYEIMNTKKIGKYNIDNDIVKLFDSNDSIYNLYIENSISLNPWVFYKVIDKKYLDYFEMFPFIRSFEENMPYFRLDYEYSSDYGIDEICVRIIVFMNEITLNYDKVTDNDIRDNNVYVSKKDNCIFFGY